jgi:uncharacterized peroxidase-related enzyme
MTEGVAGAGSSTQQAREMTASDAVADAPPALQPGMAGAVRVGVVREADASGEVAELYGELRDMFLGFVPDVFKLVSTRPDMLGVFVAGFRSMFDGGQLPREVKEVIAVTVARVASCQYCATAHDAILRLLGTDSRYADAVANGALDDPAIPAEVRVLAELARDITQHAYRITDDDLDRVRSHGWDQPQVLEAVWVACLFNAIVRLADTLGLYQLGQLADEGVFSWTAHESHERSSNGSPPETADTTMETTL